MAVGPRTLSWTVLLGAADVVALVVVLSSVRSLETGGTDARLFAVATIVGGASPAWLGLQTARDSRHVDLEAEPSRRRLVGIAALALASIGGGILVASIV